MRTNDEDSYSRQRAFLDKLPLKAQSLLKRFIEARLLVAGKDGKATVEIAHEALLRRWPKLADWLAEDRDKLRQHNAIVRAAQEWNQHRREEPYLVHRDGRLEDARKLVSEPRFAFSPGSVERDYLNACTENQLAREAAAQEERERRLKDAEQLSKEKALLAQTEKERAAAAERATKAERQARTNAEGRELAEKERAEQAEKAAREQTEAASKLRRRAWILALVAFLAIAAGGLAVLWLNSALSAEKRTREDASQTNFLLALNSNADGNYIKNWPIRQKP